MATITNANLTISHDHEKKTVRPVVTCKVNFTAAERAWISLGGKWFKLKCELWGEDSWFTGADDYLYTYSTVHDFPFGRK